MVRLYRCDICFEEIDPAIEGDELAQLVVQLKIDGDVEGTETLDLCDSCRPLSAGSHMDWLTHAMEKDLSE